MRRKGNAVTQPATAVQVTARETSIVETVRLDLTRKSPAQVLAILVDLMARIERGWKPIAIEVQVEKGVAEYSGHGKSPLRRARPGEFR